MGDAATYLSAANIGLGISVLAAYDVLPAWSYQFGFFLPVGFEYAGLGATLDLWTSAGLAARYALPTLAGLAICSFLFQGLGQLGFDLARWMVEHDLVVIGGLFLVTNVPSFLLMVFGK
ncbi:hypothetical protein ACSHT2_13670 [Bradyrhizobium sp. PUT101]|uniref:hypothetical protein n=1 Tax=Bradyrhizobium sp. PUT101 TaxID=3447427 RepID=UPI003F8506BB